MDGTREENRKELKDYIFDAMNSKDAGDLAHNRNLSEALYSFNEMGAWCEDIEIKEQSLAIEIWALVESVRLKGFPKHLRT